MAKLPSEIPNRAKERRNLVIFIGLVLSLFLLTLCGGALFTRLTATPPTPTLPSQPTAMLLTTPPPISGIPTVTANHQWAAKSYVFDGIEMILVPPGCFMMGTNTNDPDLEAENPASQQCFSAPFWIDKTLVTQEDFKRLGGVTKWSPEVIGNKQPVENITWFEARDFCNKRGARLSTEAEWEYAARGPDDLLYPWGNIYDASKVVFDTAEPANVGSKDNASWVGALDMSGNVAQWTSTIFQPYPYATNDGRENMSDTIQLRVVRGGAYAEDAFHLRAPSRIKYGPDGILSEIGVRCLRPYS